MDAASGAPLLTQPERLERRLKEIPPEPGCYLMRDGDDRILYVGDSVVMDVGGARAAGLHPVLVDPYDDHVGAEFTRITSLAELPALLR